VNTDTYAPVADITVLRLLLAVAVQRGADLKHADVSTAFLQSPITENIYVRQPQGHVRTGDDGKYKVMRLKRSLYGLKTSAKAWYDTMDKYLKTLGFASSDIIPCLYVHPDGSIILLYVDDLLIMGCTIQRGVELYNLLSTRFKMKDLGNVSLYLGIQTQYDHTTGIMNVNQYQYETDLINKYLSTEANGIATPADKSAAFGVVQPLGVPLTTSEHASYRSLVGGLQHIARWTRPDIAHAVLQLARHQAAPTSIHMTLARTVLKYLKANRYAIEYGSTDDKGLYGYCDANFAQDSSAKSVGGYVFFYAGAPVAWSSTLQSLVTRSSLESEYVSLSDAAHEGVYLRSVLNFMGVPTTSPTTIYADNTGANSLASGRAITQSTKHVNVHYHYARQAVAAGEIIVKRIATDDNIADIFTKDLERVEYVKLAGKMLSKVI
jgi:Reverse transcriptase (RNA-dependent DNA polymerase)